MRSLPKTIALAASAALFASSTAAAAAAPAPAVQQAAPSAWLVLSALSPSGQVALAGANAAAQPSNVPPPPPPLPADDRGPHFNAELLGILIWLPLIVIALGTSGSSGVPNSPD
jgi:hypothetical protein